MALDPNAAKMLQFLAAIFPDLGGEVVDAVEARKQMAGFGFPRGPEVAQLDYRLVPGPPGAPDIPVRIYWPRTALLPPYPVVVYFHPGGFVLCDLDTADGSCRVLANDASAIVVSVDYRLAPENKFPAAVDDAYAAVRWAVENAPALGGDPDQVAVAGDSSGGTLAAVTCLRARDEGGPHIAHQLLIYPATDLHELDLPSRRENGEGYFMTEQHMRWYLDQYLRHRSQAADPYVSPSRAASHAGLPPAFVMTAGYCPLRDEGEAYAAKLAAAGVPATSLRMHDLFHGFFGMGAHVPAAREAERRVAAELREGLQRRPTHGGAR